MECNVVSSNSLFCSVDATGTIDNSEAQGRATPCATLTLWRQSSPRPPRDPYIVELGAHVLFALELYAGAELMASEAALGRHEVPIRPGQRGCRGGVPSCILRTPCLALCTLFNPAPWVELKPQGIRREVRASRLWERRLEANMTLQTFLLTRRFVRMLCNLSRSGPRNAREKISRGGITVCNVDFNRSGVLSPLERLERLERLPLAQG